METTVGNYLLNRLYALGVEHIFGLPGDYVIGFDKLIEQHPHIAFVNATRENTAGYMADAYARMRGLGVACITYGVGINISNALAQAYVESSPLVVISGAVGSQEFAQSPLMHHLINKSYTAHSDRTQLEIFKQITIAQVVVENPHRAAEEIDEVLEACLQQKKPVYIELPRDIVKQPIEAVVESKSLSMQLPAICQAVLDEALEEVRCCLESAQQPIIWAGHLIQRFGLSSSLLRFAERYQIPIVSTLLGKTVIDERHPLFVGVYQGGMSKPRIQEIVESSDCALILGVLLSDIDTGVFSAKIGQQRRIIANVSDLIIGHHRYDDLSLVNFIEGLSTFSFSSTALPQQAQLFSSLEEEPFEAIAEKKMTTQRLFECLQNHLQPDHLVVSDVGDCLFGSADLCLADNSFISNAYFASVGFGIPAVIGAQMASPHKRVIGIVGDGAFQMAALELSTAIRYRLDPIIILLNNHGYATERPLLEGEFNELLDWHYSEVPKMLGGGRGVRVTTEDQLDEALAHALAHRGTLCLIEVDLEKRDFSAALQRLGRLCKSRI